MKKRRTIYLLNVLKNQTLLSKKILFVFFMLCCIYSTGKNQASSDALNQANVFSSIDIEELNPFQQRTVPQLLGSIFDYDEIATFLDTYGLELGNADPVLNNDSIGLITYQSIPSGVPINPNIRNIINVNYATQIPVYQIPNYKGWQLEDALRDIEGGPFSLGRVRQIEINAPEGEVVHQFPEPGSEQEIDTRINLFVSSGGAQNEVEVPRLIGRTMEQAEEILANSDLLIGERIPQISRRRRRRRREGTIVDQDPEPGMRVLRESRVNLFFAATEELGDESNVDPPPGNKTEDFPPPWIYWGGGILLAVLLGGLVVRRFNIESKKKPIGEKDISIDLKLVWDIGKQTIISNENNLVQNKVHLKFISDKGNQTIKNS